MTVSCAQFSRSELNSLSLAEYKHMNSEQIESFLSKNISAKSPYVRISFQKRETVYGLFLTEEKDYKDLSSKNFWRIVTQKNLDQYNKAKDPSLSRIFNGSEITRLSLLKDEA
jgi:hypothetical protein